MEIKNQFCKNKYNHIAQLHLIYKIGTDHDKELFLAVQVLQYLGTSRFSADQLSQEFFKLGISNDFKTYDDQMIISLTGFEENLIKGLNF